MKAAKQKSVRKPISPDSQFHFNPLSSQPMNEKQSVELNQDALDVVDAWLGTSTATTENTQPAFEKRAQRLGLGAKFVPPKKVSMGITSHPQKEEANSVLKKKVLREKRRKKEKMLENRDSSSDSEEEESVSKAKSIRSKAIHERRHCLLRILFSPCEEADNQAEVSSFSCPFTECFLSIMEGTLPSSKNEAIRCGKKAGKRNMYQDEGDYELVGSVFLVRCKQDNHLFALKQVRINEEDIRRT